MKQYTSETATESQIFITSLILVAFITVMTAVEVHAVHNRFGKLNATIKELQSDLSAEIAQSNLADFGPDGKPYDVRVIVRNGVRYEYRLVRP